jgi:8-oxo-dGTP diphosphatase
VSGGESPEAVVAIGVVLDGGRVLVGRRERPPLAGYAEFPGGKTLPGEPPEAAVVREVSEECGLAVRVVSLLARERGDHPNAVDLRFFLCRLTKSGAARPPRADDDPRRPFAWIPLEQLGDFSFPPPNERVLEQLRRLTRRG